ncbi:universal stress protein [Aurantibacter crassamenti]|uniref:universal stress protein n=1 Tax=Aurantibacter crassamenti TaxID=1837375 RepID=UPI001939F3E1|nr:universal stress protein [Aurantibacter crassamenti]MBM1106584.1 universal stress protein [Aurantibacter crassamenti]
MLRVLLPTDFSDNSFDAIQYTLQLLKDVECEFSLLHTYMPPIYQAQYLTISPGQIGLGDVMRENAVTNLDKLQKRIAKEYQNTNHHFQSHTCLNTLVSQVNEMVEDLNIDLIVMGTKGATGAEEILFGTHTVHVIKKAKCPVIAIPPNFKYEVPKEILFPTDYEVEFKSKPLEVLLEIAKKHIASVEVLHVSYGYELSEKQQKNKEKLDDILSSVAHLFHDQSNQEVIQAINNFQLKHKMNFLVMIQNKHTFVERMFIEPVIKKIGFHITIPFMVIPHFN